MTSDGKALVRRYRLALLESQLILIGSYEPLQARAGNG